MSKSPTARPSAVSRLVPQFPEDGRTAHDHDAAAEAEAEAVEALRGRQMHPSAGVQLSGTAWGHPYEARLDHDDLGGMVSLDGRELRVHVNVYLFLGLLALAAASVDVILYGSSFLGSNQTRYAYSLAWGLGHMVIYGLHKAWKMHMTPTL